MIRDLMNTNAEIVFVHARQQMSVAVDLMELVFWALDLKTDLLYLVVVTQRLEITSAWGK